MKCVYCDDDAVSDVDGKGALCKSHEESIGRPTDNPEDWE